MKQMVALKVVAKASEDSDTIDLELMNEIIHDDWGGWREGSTATALRSQLKGKTPKNINVAVNSFGGVASEGVAMYNILRQAADQGSKVNVTVLGIAASAASIVAMAGDTIKVATGAQIMIHKAGVMCYIDFSNSETLRKTADTLEKLDDQLASIYATRSAGKADKKKFLDLMAEESYLSGDEAIALGIATETDAELKAVACIGSEFLLGTLSFPRNSRTPNTASAPLAPAAAAATQQKENPMTKEEIVAKFPEVAAALREEGRALAAANVDAAKQEERTRIQDVLTVLDEAPGHADLKTLAFDGKSTSADAIKAVWAADNNNRKTRLNNMRAEAADPVDDNPSPTGDTDPNPANPAGEGEEKTETTVGQFEAKCLKDWKALTPKDRSLYADNFKAYHGARRADNLRGKDA